MRASGVQRRHLTPVGGASEGFPKKKDLEIEARRASWSWPCRDGGDEGQQRGDQAQMLEGEGE